MNFAEAFYVLSSELDNPDRRDYTDAGLRDAGAKDRYRRARLPLAHSSGELAGYRADDQCSGRMSREAVVVGGHGAVCCTGNCDCGAIGAGAAHTFAPCWASGSSEPKVAEGRGICGMASGACFFLAERPARCSSRAPMRRLTAVMTAHPHAGIPKARRPFSRANLDASR